MIHARQWIWTPQLRGFPLNHESIRTIFKEICSISIEDDIFFSISQITDIRETDDYPGLRVHLVANYPPLAVPMKVDVTKGDKITPREIAYSFKLLFDDRTLSIMAYNLETILAEKLETVLSRNIANTRPRDFYDIYILYTLRGPEFDMAVLRRALDMTIRKRGSLSVLVQYHEIIENIQSNQRMLSFWKEYRKEFDYARHIAFSDVYEAILRIMDKLSEQ